MRKQIIQDKFFVPASEKAECQYMKMITPENVYDVIDRDDKYEVTGS